MSRRDRAGFGVVILVMTLLSGTCWYVAGKGRVSWSEHHGEVVARRVVMPPAKRADPIRYRVTIREASGEHFTFDLSRAEYKRARMGAMVHRDRFGNVVIAEVRGEK